MCCVACAGLRAAGRHGGAPRSATLLRRHAPFPHHSPARAAARAARQYNNAIFIQGKEKRGTKNNKNNSTAGAAGAARRGPAGAGQGCQGLESPLITVGGRGWGRPKAEPRQAAGLTAGTHWAVVGRQSADVRQSDCALPHPSPPPSRPPADSGRARGARRLPSRRRRPARRTSPRAAAARTPCQEGCRGMPRSFARQPGREPWRG